ncbi:MAG: dihydrodipicolinate synthase family protein [Rubrimonas sp.]|uniref:dihydrodipicolinate synthase family protein n=1 Tax=Rubrimonas sp. TaxID=2036015 RepID=UPI003DCE61FB
MTLIDRTTRGVYVIAATPFAEDGSLDLASIDSLVDYYAARGADGMTILGVMGEAPKLTPEESRAAVSRFLSRAGGMPVIVGVSSPSTDALAGLGAFAMDAGAAGVMVAPIPSLSTEDTVATYYAAVCAALGPDVPVCFQDYPQLTGVKVSAATILKLTRDHPQIVMLKHEDCPGLAKLSAVRAAEPRMSILCGNGGLYLPQELQRGADGAMTGFAYPEMLSGVVHRHLKGDADGAEDLFDAWLPLIRHEQQPGIGLAIRKEVLRRRGAIASSRVRAPGPRLSPADLAELDRLIARTEARVRGLGERLAA